MAGINMGQQSPNMYQAYQMQYPQESYVSSGYPQKNSSGPSVTCAVAVGGIGGGTVGYLKNRRPVSKDGNVSEKFVNDVFEKNLKTNCSSDTQQYFKQLKNVINNIDKVRTPEAFKNLINQNKELVEVLCKGISSETLIASVTSSNLQASKTSLKESLQAIKNFELIKTKNAIRMAWDPETKKFVEKSDFKDSELFNVIKKTKSNAQWKKALKYGGISAGILGMLTLGCKLLEAKANSMQ